MDGQDDTPICINTIAFTESLYQMLSRMIFTCHNEHESPLIQVILDLVLIQV